MDDYYVLITCTTCGDEIASYVANFGDDLGTVSADEHTCKETR